MNVFKDKNQIKTTKTFFIKGINLSWFHSCLISRIQYILITPDLETDTKNISYGVPHGPILGPLLFLLYVNDLSNLSALDLIMFTAGTNNLFYERKDLETLFFLVNQELRKSDEWL